MMAGRVARTACVALVCALLWGGRSSAAVTRQQLDLATVTNAHYRAHRLLGNCMTSPNLLGANRENVDSYIRILEAVELTRSVAAQYRSSIVKIELGVRYFQQARQATGKRRTELVGLANEAMRAAAALLDVAVRIFNEVQPQLVRFFASAQRPRDGNGNRPQFPIEVRRPFFEDCVPEKVDLRCCRDNYEKAMLLLESFAKDLTREQRRAIQRCLDDTLARCLQLYNRNRIKFNKEYWENCFEGYVTFV